jgi:hypothetical protein
MTPTRTRITMTTILTALGLSIVTAACGASAGAPEEGNAFLTVVGDRNVFLDYGQRTNVAVRYHDSNDEPLAGEISLTMGGNTAGSQLSASSGVTDAQGIVSVELTAGSTDVFFDITAEAEYADPATFSITVSEGAKPLPMLIEGKYTITSNYDLTQSLPGSLGSVVGTLSAIGNSPGGWLANELDLPGFVGPALDSLIKSKAPQLVNDMLAVANNVSSAAHNFGTITTVEAVKGAKAGESTAKMTMTGFKFRLNNQDVTLTIDQLGGDEPMVENVILTVDDKDNVTIAQHDMPLAYGGFLVMALNETIIPAVDPYAGNLDQLLSSRIDCAAVGQSIFNTLGFGTVNFYTNACRTGISAGAQAITSELAQIDQRSPLIMRITGIGKVKDTNSDRKVDSITGGKWAGLLDYSGQQGTLGETGNTFEATKAVQ